MLKNWRELKNSISLRFYSMFSVKRKFWLLISFVIIATTVSAEFTKTLTWLDVAGHLSILSGIYCAFACPPEDVLDGIGLTLFDVFVDIYDRYKLPFVELSAKRIIFFKTYSASLPAFLCFYFVHGNLCMVEPGVGRFPGLLDYPQFWNAMFAATVTGSLVYHMRIRNFRAWPGYQYYIENPEASGEIQTVVDDPQTYHVNYPQHAMMMFTRGYFIYFSNWKMVAVKTSDVTFQVDNTRIPVIPNEPRENEQVRYIFVKAMFRQHYLTPFPFSLRHDNFRQINEILAVPIYVPDHIDIPRTILELMIEDFVWKTNQNSRYTFRVKRSEQDLCFACGTDQNMVKLQKECTGDEPRPEIPGMVVRHLPCDSCQCKPLWCQSCMGRIFIGKQTAENVHRDQYDQGVCSCPTCRRQFCIFDVHPVDFDYIED